MYVCIYIYIYVLLGLPQVKEKIQMKHNKGECNICIYVTGEENLFLMSYNSMSSLKGCYSTAFCS